MEGARDAEFLGTVLRHRGLQRIKQYKNLPAGWQKLVPSVFPHQGDLLTRVPVPFFLTRDGELGAVISPARGVDRLGAQCEEDFVLGPTDQIQGIGVIFDADYKQSAHSRYESIRTQFKVPLPKVLGAVERLGDRWAGAFAMPDNLAVGTMEDLLSEMAEKTYAGLCAHADQFVAGFPRAGLSEVDLAEINLPAGRLKARLSAISAILRPGKSLQTSLEDTRWICPDSIRDTRCRKFQEFLDRLLDGGQLS